MAVPIDLVRRPLYVYDLPESILKTLRPKDDVGALDGPPEPQAAIIHGNQEGHPTTAAGVASSTSCSLCGISFANVSDQRDHVRSDLHGYNLKQRVRGLEPVTEGEFEKLIGDLVESISGSDSSESDDDEEGDKGRGTTLTALLKKQAATSPTAGAVENSNPKSRRGATGNSPLFWFTTPLLPSNVSLGMYRAVFTDQEQQHGADILETVQRKQITPGRIPMPSAGPIGSGTSLQAPASAPHIFLCMIGGGHFAAMVVSLAPKTGKRSGTDEHQVNVLTHKTFHRYTTRRKQGGAQSSNDAAKGAAHSAGSSLRRYNEGALTAEIRLLLSEWKSLIDTAQLLFVRATGSTNRRTLYGPYEGQVLRLNDPRKRGFPFSTRRATQGELMRAFVELTRVKVSQVDDAALAAAAAEAQRSAALTSKPEKAQNATVEQKISKEDEAASLHTSQLEAMIRRSKAPAVVSYFSGNSLPPGFLFYPHNTQHHHHAATPLHLAASVNSAAVVTALLTKARVDPSLLNGEGKPAFDLAGDRSTRDAFRVSRHELGEDSWDWAAAHVPPALNKADADDREQRERKEAVEKEAERRKAEVQRLQNEGPIAESSRQGKKNLGKALGVGEKTGAQKREEEARGMTPEMKTKLERERRARAAEERFKRMQTGE